MIDAFFNWLFPQKTIWFWRKGQWIEFTNNYGNSVRIIRRYFRKRRIPVAVSKKGFSY
jgi:hypothetical protein